MVSPSQMFQGNLRLYILDSFFARMAARDIGAELQLDSKVLASRFNTFKNKNQHQRGVSELSVPQKLTNADLFCLECITLYQPIKTFEKFPITQMIHCGRTKVKLFSQEFVFTHLV